MRNIVLARCDRETGMRHYAEHVAMNETGYNFLSDILVLLLAMQLGANNMQLGYLVAAMYFTGIAVLLMPSFFGGLRLVSACWLLWLLQGLCCLPYFLAAWLFDEYQSMALWLLLAGFTGFAMLRNFAWPMKHGIEHGLILSEVSGTVLPRLNRVASYARIGGSLLGAGVLAAGIFSETRTLLLLGVLGLILNSLAALCLRAIPMEDRIVAAGSGAVRALLEEIWKREHLPSVVLYCVTVATVILGGFAAPLFRNEAGMPLGWIMVFAALCGGAVWLAGWLTPKWSQRFGVRILLGGSGVALAVAGGVLSLLRPWTPWAIWLLVGLVMALAQGILAILAAKLVLRRIPVGNKVGFLTILNFAAAWIALLIGLAAGRCADSQLFHILHLTNNYSGGFMVLAILALLMAAYGIFFSREPLTVTDADVQKLLLSTENLNSFLLVEQLGESERDRLKEKIVLTAESDTVFGLAAEEVRRRLKTAQTDIKDDLLRSLFFHPRQELGDELAAEAADRDSWCRESALFALGAYHDTRSEQALLREYHNESDEYLRSVAVKSLARLGYAGELLLDLRRMLFEHAHENVRTTVNLLIALVLADREGLYLGELFRLSRLRTGETYRQQAYVILSRRLGGEPGLEHFFDLENLESGRGSGELLAETAGSMEFVEAGDALRGWLSEPDYPSIMAWCRKQVGLLTLSDHLEKLAAGIDRGMEINPGKTDAIAALYFTWLVIRNHRLGQERFNWRR